MFKKNHLYIICIAFITACANDPNYLDSGFPNFIRINNGFAYVSNGELGLDIIDLASMQTVHRMLPQREMNSIDAMSIDGDLLFLVDARGEDYLAVYSLSDPIRPTLVSGPIGVNGGPFTGVSAANGNVVVSGGTTHLNYRKYDTNGKLSTAESIFGRDRGHPDVLLSSDGAVAYLSTDFNDIVDDAEFGIVTILLDDLAGSPVLLSELGIPGSGFSNTTTRPTGFPIKTAIVGNHLAVAHNAGFTLIELIEGRYLAGVNTIDIDLEATNLAVNDLTAYVIGRDPSPTLVQIDLTDINSPVVTDRMDLSITSVPTSIAVTDDLILIAANEDGIIVINQ